MTRTTPRVRRRRPAVAIAAGAMLLGVVACSGGGGKDTAPSSTGAPPAPTVAPTTGAPTTTDVPPTTAAATTTDEPRLNRPPRTDPTTTLPPIPRMPLTGQVLTFGQVPPDRPALVVKIDNHPLARPQTGLNQADVVFEEIVEGSITRFAAVFHSGNSNPVGPIRSGRTQDVDLLSGLNQPLFAWSGGNPGVTAAIDNSDFISINAVRGGGGYYRTERAAPHDLYNSTDSLYSQATPEAGRPDPLFRYVRPENEVGGENTSWVDVLVGSNPVRWEWAPETGTYRRFQSGSPHMQTDGQVTADNVVILLTGYRPSSVDARSPEAITVGEGYAFVFSDGTMQVGIWKRDDNRSPIDLRDPKGRRMLIAPGRTWVELADANANTVETG